MKSFSEKYYKNASVEQVLVRELLEKLIERVRINSWITFREFFRELSFVRFEKQHFLLIIQAIEKNFPFFRVEIGKGKLRIVYDAKTKKEKKILEEIENNFW